MFDENVNEQPQVEKNVIEEVADSSNDSAVQQIPPGSVITEEMIEYHQGVYGVNRDVAIGSLLGFEAGKGQPWTELFEKFPAISEAYYSHHSVSEEEPAQPEVVEEPKKEVQEEQKSAEGEAEVE